MKTFSPSAFLPGTKPPGLSWIFGGVHYTIIKTHAKTYYAEMTGYHVLPKGRLFRSMQLIVTPSGCFTGLGTFNPVAAS